MSPPAPLVLALQRTVAAPARAVWAALTTPAMMQRWMLVPASVVPDAPLAPGSRIEWRDDDGKPYLVGTVTVCEPARRLTVELQDRSWPRLARAGEVTWSFELTERQGVTRLDYRLGDLAIDPEAQEWLAAYREADEPARVAAVTIKPSTGKGEDS
ncbi:MAG: SRPBCC domain-containing protein [Thiobacillus sp.]|nr:SRPBCC domain-containing protein [Thiobacillus sp.]